MAKCNSDIHFNDLTIINSHSTIPKPSPLSNNHLNIKEKENPENFESHSLDELKILPLETSNQSQTICHFTKSTSCFQNRFQIKPSAMIQKIFSLNLPHYESNIITPQLKQNSDLVEERELYSHSNNSNCMEDIKKNSSEASLNKQNQKNGILKARISHSQDTGIKKIGLFQQQKRNKSLIQESGHQRKIRLLNQRLKTLNQYEVIKCIGKGRYGKTKLTLLNNIQYAIKVIKQFSISNKSQFLKNKDGTVLMKNDFIEIFTELEVLKKIRHPNLVKIFELINSDNRGKLLLIQEYIEGGQICKWNPDKMIFTSPFFQNQQCQEGFIKKVIRECASSIFYLHDTGVIHGDIKPENILYNGKQIKISDFGMNLLLNFMQISEQISYQDQVFSPPENFEQIEKQCCEQFWHNLKKGWEEFITNHSNKCIDLTNNQKERKHFINEQGDIWSFGVCVYCLAFGKHPFYHPNINFIPYMIKFQQLQFPNSHPYSKELINLIKQLLDKNPYLRPTAKQLMSNPWINQDLIQLTNIPNQNNIQTKQCLTQLNKHRTSTPYFRKSQSNENVCEPHDEESLRINTLQGMLLEQKERKEMSFSEK